MPDFVAYSASGNGAPTATGIISFCVIAVIVLVVKAIRRK